MVLRVYQRLEDFLSLGFRKTFHVNVARFIVWTVTAILVAGSAAVQTAGAVAKEPVSVCRPKLVSVGNQPTDYVDSMPSSVHKVFRPGF